MDIRTKLVHTFSLLNKRVYFTAIYLKLKISKETMSQDILKFNGSFKYFFYTVKKHFSFKKHLYSILFLIRVYLDLF